MTRPRVRSQHRVAADRTAMWVAAGATIVSIAAVIYVHLQGNIVGYGDAASHLQIARRVLDSPTAGFAQLGSVWLPLQHVLMLPFIWYSPLFYSGIAGSIVSMAGYVVACVYLYRVVHGLTDGNRPAAIAGTLVFALNPNIIYMQSIPMAELLFFATTAATLYYLQAWIQTERKSHLFAAAFACAFGVLTRYESWLMTMLVFTVIVLIVAMRRYDRTKTEGSVLGFVFIAWAPVFGWVGWNWLIMGNPLYFQLGEYASSALWVNPNDPSVGDLPTAVQTYGYAVLHNLGIPIAVAMVAGIGALLVRRRRLDALPTLSLAGLPLFFIWAVYSGTRPMNVEETSGYLYNLRFGLVVALLAAIAIGYLISLLPTAARLPSAVAAAVLAVGVTVGGVITVTETQTGVARAVTDSRSDVSAFLRGHYDGGLVLQESFDNETVLFHARIPLRNHIYEGSYRLWEPALAFPAANDIEWIVMRGGARPDKVFQALSGSVELSEYRLVYRNDEFFVYERG
ncbi:glycosyltransferase family 39 protein [Mycolicibacterium phlei]